MLGSWPGQGERKRVADDFGPLAAGGWSVVLCNQRGRARRLSFASMPDGGWSFGIPEGEEKEEKGGSSLGELWNAGGVGNPATRSAARASPRSPRVAVCHRLIRIVCLCGVVVGAGGQSSQSSHYGMARAPNRGLSVLRTTMSCGTEVLCSAARWLWRLRRCAATRTTASAPAPATAPTIAGALLPPD